MCNFYCTSTSGGVGCAATQLAKTIKGVKVVGSASQTKEEAAKANGVDNVVNYDNLENQVRSIYPEGLDLIIDNQAGKTFQTLQNLLKPLGRITLIGKNTLM